MNDHRALEHDVHLALDEHAPMQPPNHLLRSFEFNARRRRRYPRWLALIKEPSMRTDSHLVVGSPTARLAAIVMATLLLAAGIIGAGFAGSRLLAADDTLVVDAGGDGDYTTIQAALADAGDGTRILVKSGTYQGPVDITANVEVRGEDRDGVVIEFGYGCTEIEDGDASSTECPEDSWLYDDFWYDPWPYGLLLRDTDAIVSDLTIRKAPDVGGSGFVVTGGAPTIERISYTGEGDFGNVYVHGGSSAVISDSDFGPMWVFFEDGAPATIQDSTTEGYIRMHAPALGVGEAPSDLAPQVARNNTASNIEASGPAEIIGNTLDYDPVASEGEAGIAIEATGFGPATIADNEITGYQSGIYGYGRIDTVVVRGNTLVDNGVAISGFGGADLSIEDNEVTGGQTGITVSGIGPVTGNVIEGVAGRGLAISTSADVTVSGNRVCGNGEDLFVAERATAEIDDTNDFCGIASIE